MLWLIPFLLVCVFLVFRFVSPWMPTGLDVSVGSDGSTGSMELDGFQASMKPTVTTTGVLSAEFQKRYREWVTWMRDFRERWGEAVDTAWAIETSQKRAPTDEERNEVVGRLVGTVGKPFPLFGEGFPDRVETLEDADRARLMERVPTGSVAHANAVEWMNAQMMAAQKKLDEVMGSLGSIGSGGLGGLGGLGVEGFDGSCAALVGCLKDPEVMRGLATAQAEEAEARRVRTEVELLSRFEQFRSPKLVEAMRRNGELRAKTREIRAKAESGDWVKDLPASATAGSGLTAPPGAGALEDLKRADPERYRALSASPWFGVKGLIDQINRGLR